MAKPIESFRGLKVGDQVRLVDIPTFYREGYYFHRDTMWVYRQLLKRGRPMRICFIDEWDLPYVHCRFRRKSGGFAQIYASLKQQKVRTKTMDLRIASIALASGMTLLTRNTVDFERVPGLRIEDWTLPKAT